jgi:hypothetical protein
VIENLGHDQFGLDAFGKDPMIKNDGLFRGRPYNNALRGEEKSTNYWILTTE